MNIYFYLPIFILLLFPCQVDLMKNVKNGTKIIRLKVLWSTFEENTEKILTRTDNKFIDHRFQILLRRKDEKKNAALDQRINTDQFDIREIHVNDNKNLHLMDVGIKLNDKKHKQKVTFPKLAYEEGKILILPYNDKFQLSPVSMAYDNSIFDKPVRHFRFVVSKRIVPVQIDCIERPAYPLPRHGHDVSTIWSHEFHDGSQQLDIQEVVCQYGIYKFKYMNVDGEDEDMQIKEHEIDLVCDEPVYDLGFVNHFDILHSEVTNALACSLDRNIGIQRSGPIQFHISDLSKNEVERRAPFLAEYKKKIDEIMANYVEQQLELLMQEGRGISGKHVEQQLQAVHGEEVSADAEAYKRKLKDLEKLLDLNESLDSHESVNSQMLLTKNHQVPQNGQHFHVPVHPEQGFSPLIEQRPHMVVQASFTDGQPSYGEHRTHAVQAIRRKRPLSPVEQQIGAVHAHSDKLLQANIVEESQNTAKRAMLAPPNQLGFSLSPSMERPPMSPESPPIFFDLGELDSDWPPMHSNDDQPGSEEGEAYSSALHQQH